MKKAISVILCTGLLLSACQKGDDYKDVPSNERQILWASAPGQIGTTLMPDRAGLDLNNIIKIQVLPDIDITTLPVELAISPGATVTPASGEPQDFSKGHVEYTVTSQTGIDRTFRIEVSVFEEVLIGKWSVSSVEIISDMDISYGTPRWPAPGMGQKAGVTINHNATTPVYTPVTNGVELDNTLEFEFSTVDSDGNTIGILKTDPGEDEKTTSREIISNFLEEINIVYESPEAYHYPEDFYWLPAEEGTSWTHNVSNGTLTFQSGSNTLKCTITTSGDNTLTLTLPTNPNKEAVYDRPSNDGTIVMICIQHSLYSATHYRIK